MSKQLKIWSLVLSLFVTMLASPVAGMACDSCAMHRKAAETSVNCCGQIVENHCPPESDAASQNTHFNIQTAALNNVGAKTRIGCRCLKDESQRQTVLDRQKVQPQHWFPVILPTQLNFSPVIQTTAIVFFKPNFVYPARSALSDLPSRAPPAL